MAAVHASIVPSSTSLIPSTRTPAVVPEAWADACLTCARFAASSPVFATNQCAAMRSGEMDPSALEEALNIRTRRLARMQDTWMRKMAPDVMIDLGDGPATDGVARVVAEWRRARGGVG